MTLNVIRYLYLNQCVRGLREHMFGQLSVVIFVFMWFSMVLSACVWGGCEYVCITNAGFYFLFLQSEAIK